MRPGRSWLAAAVAASVAVLPAAACGDGDADRVLTIPEAFEQDEGEEVTVEGLLLANRDGTYLCSALAESFPPQCAPPALTVSGLSLTSVDGVQQEGDVRWRDQPIRLTGRMTAGMLALDGPPTTVGGPAND